MASGKSALARLLSAKLNVPSYDLDAMIEQSIGRTINQLFEELGESRFREIERATLLRCASLSPAIIASGGGTPCFFNNIDEMKKTGMVVFLDTSENIIMQRLKSDKHHRPLVKKKTEEELNHFVTQELAARRPYYERAHLQLIIDQERPDYTALINYLKRVQRFNS